MLRADTTLASPIVRGRARVAFRGKVSLLNGLSKGPGVGHSCRRRISTQAEDTMMADWTCLPYDVLARISTRITNSLAEVNRVVLYVTSKPSATIEWE